MLTFKTQFPISGKKTTADFLECARIWVSGSPHAELAHKLSAVKLIDGASYRSPNETLTVLAYEEEERSIAGVRYEKREEDQITWLTDVVASKTEAGFEVAVQLSVDSDLPVEKLDQGKRPYVIKSIMQHLGGGVDGNIRVQDCPLILEEGDISKAADILCGRAGLVMPVVYVSVDNKNETYVNSSQLAKWLSGMAHVVLEPSRDFSFSLMREVYGENVYGGAVGIYWPDGIGKWTFLPSGIYKNSNDLQAAVARKVRSSLLSQRTRRECTWSNLQELISRRRLQELKDSGSNDVNEYIRQFDAEILSKNQEIIRLENALALAGYGYRNDAGDAMKRGRADIGLSSNEGDFYQGERLEIIIDALRAASDGAQVNSRRKDILSDLVDENAQDGERSAILEHLKPLLNQYSSMTAVVRSNLEGIGFTIIDEGKHYKLLFRGDTRYPFILSKTSSDWRAGRNAFSDLRRLLF